eukprot:6204552-Pleurochrysis_carterae.AAC.3
MFAPPGACVRCIRIRVHAHEIARAHAHAHHAQTRTHSPTHALKYSRARTRLLAQRCLLVHARTRAFETSTRLDTLKHERGPSTLRSQAHGFTSTPGCTKIRSLSYRFKGTAVSKWACILARTSTQTKAHAQTCCNAHALTHGHTQIHPAHARTRAHTHTHTHTHPHTHTPTPTPTPTPTQPPTPPRTTSRTPPSLTRVPRPVRTALDVET